MRPKLELVERELAGINLICGAGMSDFESGLSFEKVVIDAEAQTTKRSHL